MKKIWLYLGIGLGLLLGALSLLGKTGDDKLAQKRRNLERQRKVYEDSDVENQAAERKLADKLREIDEKLEEDPDPITDPDDAAARLRDEMGWGSDES